MFCCNLGYGDDKKMLRFLGIIEDVERRVHNAFKNRPHRVLYRGVGNFRFRPIPGLMRLIQNMPVGKLVQDIEIVEREIVDGVEREYYDELHKFSFVEKLIWLQHYGFPTRLLDVTRNKLVALYFAVTGSDVEKDGAFYVVGVPEEQVVCVKDIEESELPGISPTLLLSPALTERQRRQQGEFILMGNRKYSWYEDPGRNACSFDLISKQGIIIEEKHVSVGDKEEMRRELCDGYGITTHYLFPENPTAYKDELVRALMMRVRCEACATNRRGST